MLLGKYGGLDRIPTLRKLLLDDEVSGHAVYSLRLLGAVEAKEDIQRFLESPNTWIRNEAKKYFKKIERIKTS
jgi:HEAT repeat protein